LEENALSLNMLNEF